MGSRGRVAVMSAAVAGLAAIGAPAIAQTVPMPIPAPHSRGLAPQPTAPAPAQTRAAQPPALPAPRIVNQHRVAQATPAPPAAMPGRPPAGSVAKPGGAMAFDGNQRALVERANSYLTSVQTLVGNFVQVGPDGNRTDGRFYLQKPGKIRFEYNPPSVIDLIADGSSVVVRDRRLATQDLYPLSQTPLRFLLTERIDLLKDTNVVGAYADDTFVTIVIEEKQTFGGTHRLMLMFGARDNQLRQWTITDPQGYDTTVALYNTDAKQKPDPTLFKIDYTRYVQ
jgi:outer membrane lipoprotein-sorting protein